MIGGPLSRAIAEAGAIARAAGTLTIIWTDTKPVIQKNVTSAAQMRPRGGGGTDVTAGIKAAEEIRHGAPQLIITITDGFTNWPECPPRAKHVAVITTRGKRGPYFGKVIHIDE
jgi:predicted metal-dependent peptidase